VARFIQPDPVLDTLNRYAYCRNNPVKYTDPTGNQSISMTLQDLSAFVSANRDALGTIMVGAIEVVAGAVLGGGGTAGGASLAVATAGAGTPAGVAVASSSIAAGQALIACGAATIGVGLASLTVGKAPEPNNGQARPHGKEDHNRQIDDKISKIKEDPEVENVRKNQEQVDVDGNGVGRNRPDVQYDKGGRHHVVEIDRSSARSEAHGEKIQANDADASVELNLMK
jgi:hypothetical protein